MSRGTAAGSVFRWEDGPTPEFAIWTLPRACPLREGVPQNSPQAVARHLKALAAIDHCQRGGWSWRGALESELCIDPRSLESAGELRGCFVREVTEFYGGESWCQETCRDCPANVRRHAFEDYPPLVRPESSRWAGCFGWLRRDPGLVAGVERWLRDCVDVAWCERIGVLPTSPGWNGLWCQAEWTGPRLTELRRLWLEVASSTGATSPAAAAELSDWLDALDAAVEHHLALTVELVPAGWTAGTTWTIAAHCPRCRQALPTTAKGCACCGRGGGPHPGRRRRRLGFRPFLELRGLVDSQQFEIIKQSVATLGPNSRTCPPD